MGDMSADFGATLQRIVTDGFSVMRGIFDANECRRLGDELDVALAECADDKTVLRRANGTIYGARNLLAIRPLLSHCSGVSDPTTTRRRRVIHLEYAASRSVPDGYSWHEFWPV